MVSHIQRRSVRTIVSSVMISVIIVVMSMFATATPASANAGDCQTPSIGVMSDRVDANACVLVETGWKDSRDHTEWVGHVEVHKGKTPDDKLEIWGDGFYYAGRGTDMEVYVDKRVRNNTYVCGATSDHWGVRVVACIHISV
jgi:hypothetical protein